MITLTTLSFIFHFIGLSLGTGAATVKVWLVVRCRADNSLIPAYIRVFPVMTRQIVIGMILVTLSGITWLVLGYEITALLIVKIILVAAIWILGPCIDNLVEPKYRKLAPPIGETATPDFLRVQRQYLFMEIIATLLFYVIIVMWVWGN